MERALRSLAVVAAVGLLAGPGTAEQTHITVDARYRAPQCTILRGHAEDLGDIADLLEDLGRNAEVEEPVLRGITRSVRGYEYTIVVPEPVPAPQAVSPWKPLPFFAAVPVARNLFRLLVPPFT